MKKTYISPSSERIALFSEAEIALNTVSGGDAPTIEDKDEFLSNEWGGGWSSERWTETEE